MSKICVIAPHADDETLGCGGTILKHKKNGDKVYWICITSMKSGDTWSEKEIKKRDNEIKKVSKSFKFDQFYSLDLAPKNLDQIPLTKIIDPLTKIFNKIKPDILYVPFYADAHSDHQIIGKTFNALGKWFRYPYLKKIYCYETISETEFNITSNEVFKPNKFIDISEFIKKKIRIMKIYKSEIGKSPFPRSVKSIESLGTIRGSQSGFKYAEAFILLMDRS